MAVFADPLGAPFSIWQPRQHVGAGLVNEPGTLCWNELVTRDTDRAKAFYRAVFGWEPASQMMGTSEYTEWKLGDRPVGGMMPMGEDWPPEIPAHWLVYFAVTNTDNAAERAASLGGQVSVPATDIEPGRFAVLNDPQGGQFGVFAPKQG
jgi:uncharacterized protein